MLNVNKPVIFDCLVDPNENCFPMIPSGKPHNQMLLDQKMKKFSEGKVLVLKAPKSAYSAAIKQVK